MGRWTGPTGPIDCSKSKSSGKKQDLREEQMTRLCHLGWSALARRFGAVCALAGALSATSGANAQEDFYRGKTVTFIIGFGPGGGYDLYARVLGRFIANHIPGRPNVVSQNLEGAGSVRAANFVYNTAPRDGTSIAAVNQNMPMYQLLGGKAAQFEAAKLAWIG